MTSSTKWAVGIALLLVCLCLGGAYVWQRPLSQAFMFATPTATPPAAAPTRRAQGEPGQTLTPSTATAPPSEAMVPKSTVPKSTIAEAPGAATEPPHFDVVRVEPKGDTVVAGKGEANATIALLASGKVVAEAKADASGQFVLLPPPLAPGDYDLTLRQSRDGKPATVSAQSVTVLVPKAATGGVVVALAEPGKATKVLSAPPAPVATTVPVDSKSGGQPVAAPAPMSPPAAATASADKALEAKLTIGAVDLENGTGFHASGSAAPGTAVHVYLNDSRLADVTAGKDGLWSVTIRKGLSGGHYRVRADGAGSGAGTGATVTARAEVPFDVPVAMAALPPATTVSPADSRSPDTGRGDKSRDSREAADGVGTDPRSKGDDARDPSGTPGPDASRAVIDQVVTHQVSNGDNLWTISRRSFGEGRRFTQIYQANATQIRDPALIYPGQVFVLPAK